MLSLIEILESGGVGLGLSILGTYLHSRRKGAEALDAGLLDTISTRDSTIETLQTALKQPVISQHELYNRQRVRDWLAGADEAELGVLKFLVDHGESLSSQVYENNPQNGDRR